MRSDLFYLTQFNQKLHRVKMPISMSINSINALLYRWIMLPRAGK